MGLIFSDAKSLKIKLVLLYSAAVLSFLFTLLSLIGAHPVLPWWSILKCEDVETASADVVGQKCRSVEIGLLKTRQCAEGMCKTVQNTDLALIAPTLHGGNITQTVKDTNGTTYELNKHVSYTVNTDFGDMGDVEIAGIVAFLFMLLGFLINLLCGLVCFHHLTTGKAGRKVNLVVFIATAVCYLIAVSVYLGKMGSSEDVSDFCEKDFGIAAEDAADASEAKAVAEEAAKEDEEDIVEVFASEHCSMYIGATLALLSFINMFVGSVLAWFTTNPESEELEMTEN